MSEQQLPRAPSALSRAGRRLWMLVIEEADSQDIELDSLEKSYLEDACRLADRIEQMETTLPEPETGLMVSGYQRQPVAHPLLGEIRESRQLRGQLLASIKVTARWRVESPSPGGVVLPMGVQQRDAVAKRWGKG
jgi:hypothetical protein